MSAARENDEFLAWAQQILAKIAGSDAAAMATRVATDPDAPDQTTATVLRKRRDSGVIGRLALRMPGPAAGWRSPDGRGLPGTGRQDTIVGKAAVCRGTPNRTASIGIDFPDPDYAVPSDEHRDPQGSRGISPNDHHDLRFELTTRRSMETRPDLTMSE